MTSAGRYSEGITGVSAEPEPESLHESPDAFRTKRTLLVVDDEAHVRSALVRLLRPDGYEILTAAGAAEGVDLLGRRPVQVILSDQRMPGEFGIEFLGRVKQRFPRTIRMILSGHAEMASVADAIGRDVVHRFIAKPWNNEALRAHVRDAFRHHAQIHPDIGSAAHYVAVPADRDEEPVREFASFTADLNALADWLERCEVKIVAMESTGVYWIPLYELLQRRGFEVLLVNARHVKNVSGRKSDVLDCQWLQQLLSFGLLRGAFRPDDKVCELRSITRQRAMLLKSQGRHVQHMQKALTQMNIQLANVISDVAGVTGQKIIREIVAGERDPQVLAAYRDVRIKASEHEIAKSLHGNWRAEHLFALKQALAGFDFCVSQLAECDTETQRVLEELHVHEGSPAKGKKRSRSRNAPKFDVREHLFKVCGVDLTRIDGITSHASSEK